MEVLRCVPVDGNPAITSKLEVTQSHWVMNQDVHSDRPIRASAFRHELGFIINSEMYYFPIFERPNVN